MEITDTIVASLRAEDIGRYVTKTWKRYETRQEIQMSAGGRTLVFEIETCRGGKVAADLPMGGAEVDIDEVPATIGEAQIARDAGPCGRLKSSGTGFRRREGMRPCQ